MSHISLTLLAALVLMSAPATAQNAADTPQSTNAEHSAPSNSAAPAPPVAPVPRPVEPVTSGEPHTEMLPDNSAPDPLLDLKPLPRANLSLVGGIARKVDMVHNRVTVQPFGGGNKYVIYFDERTRFLSGGRETTVLAIHPGARVYADTQAVDGRVFARTIQVRNASAASVATRKNDLK